MATIGDRAPLAAVARGSNVRGIVAMIVSVACFVTGDMLIKSLGRDMPVGQIMFLRGVFSLILICPLVLATGGYRHIRTALTPLVGLRAASEVGATLLFFSGIVLMPFGDAAAIGQFTPLAVTAGAALFLKEPVGWRRWLATAVGFVGILLIIRPGSGGFNPAALLLLSCVLCVTVRELATRLIGHHVPVLVLILITAVATTLTGLAGRSLEDWVAPTGIATGLLALSAIGVSGGYYASVVAMRSGEISVVAPFRYAGMLFALMWGYVIFGEIPDPLTWTGIAIVVAAGVYMFHRETVRKREAAVVSR
jgi:drug/metabolite transporter (DMT)-like permease